MKKALLLFITIFIISSFNTFVEGQKHVRLFLLSGQSNMAGGDYLIDHTPPTEDQIWFRISSMSEDVNNAVDEWTFIDNIIPGTSNGLEKTFAEEMQELYPDDIIAVLKVYRSGAGIPLWLPNYDGTGWGWKFFTTRIDSTVNDLNRRVTNGDISSWEWMGFAWMQGESDAAYAASSIYSEVYKSNFEIVAANMREYINAPDIPIVIGRIFKFDTRENLETGPWYNLNQVRWAQTRVALDVSRSAYINTDDLPMRCTNPHYQEKFEMGRRYAQAYRNIINNEQKPFRPYRTKVVWIDATSFENPTEEGLHVTEGDAQLTIDWDYALYANYYSLHYGTDPDNLDQEINNITGNQYTITGLSNGTTYYFTAQSHNSDGASDSTVVLSGTPTLPGSNSAPWVWLQDLKHFPTYEEWLDIDDSLFLDATVRDENMSTANYLWEMVSGPGTVDFASSTSMDSYVSFSATGIYVLRFTANDGALLTSEDITVNVFDNTNAAPEINLGDDVTLKLSSILTIKAIISDDYMPELGVWTYNWEVISGPGVVTLMPDTARHSMANVSFSETGTYTIRLTINDSELSNSDEINIMVYEGYNAALNKPASQSSLLYAAATPDVAVDGIIEPDQINHTQNDLQAWWEVDLEAVYDITKIKIYNRMGSVQNRLSNYYVIVSSDPFASQDLNTTLNQTGVWSQFNSDMAEFPTEIDYNAQGRYVRIQLQGTNYLHMSEVQVFVADNDPPDPPSNLAYSNITYNSIDLEWNSAEDNIQVVNYIIYNNTDSLTISSDTVFTLTGLSPTTSYNFTVTALDIEDNESLPSNVLSVTTPANPDNIAPSKPEGLSASINLSTISLTWDASTDNVGIYRYEIFIDGISIAYALTPFYEAVGTYGTTYQFRITAEDAAGNVSDTSDLYEVSIPIQDTEAPSVPQNLISSAITSSNFTLSWDVSTDNVAVTEYEVFQDGISIGTVTDATINVSGLNASTAYNMTVLARDATGNESVQSSVLIVTTTANSDTEAPSIPQNLVSSAVTSSGFTLSWNASTDNISVIEYEVFQNGSSIETVTTTTINISGLIESTAYNMTVLARDGSGNESAQSSILIVTTSANPDTDAPSIPLNLVSSSITNSSFTLSWDASTDNVAVTEYEVFQDGSSIETVSSTTVNVLGLSESTAYNMTVLARDGSGNESAQSSILIVTTSANPDTDAPSIPLNLVSSSITNSSFTLSWDASTDNVAVTEYEVFQDGISIGISSSTSINITGLLENNSYSITILARDAAGNESDESNVLTVSTLSSNIENGFIKNVCIFPNPANDKLFIETTVNISSLSLYQLNGKLVYKLNNVNNNDVLINIPVELNGVYVIYIHTETNSIISRNIIIQ